MSRNSSSINGTVNTHQKSAAVDVLSIIYWKTNACEGVLFLQIQTNYRQVSLVNINHDMHYPSHWVFIFSKVAFILVWYQNQLSVSSVSETKLSFGIVTGVKTILKMKMKWNHSVFWNMNAWQHFYIQLEFFDVSFGIEPIKLQLVLFSTSVVGQNQKPGFCHEISYSCIVSIRRKSCEFQKNGSLKNSWPHCVYAGKGRETKEDIRRNT